MSFLQLGIINARRSLTRSVFAIMALFIVSGFLTYAIGISRGQPLMYQADGRAIIGGDIVMYTKPIDSDIAHHAERAQFRFLGEEYFTDLSVFRPELFTRGYLEFTSQPDIAWEHLAQDIAMQPDIAAVYPRYQLPAYRVDGEKRIYMPLHGRSQKEDQLLVKAPSELITAGRWFNASDEGELVAVVSERMNGALPAIDSVIQVEIPRIAMYNGHQIVERTNPHVVELKVIGHILAATRTLNSEAVETPEQTLYWKLDEIQVPMATWEFLWQLCGGEAYIPEQFTCTVGDVLAIQDTLAGLRQRYPYYSWHSVASQLAQAEQRGLIEDMNTELRRHVMVDADVIEIPMDFRVPLATMLLINSALVVASHLLILLHERRQEIGVLKTLGSQRRQIIHMILGETLLLALCGTAAGFVVFSLPTVLNQIISGLSMVTIASTLVLHAGFVFGCTLSFTLAFALLPAFRSAGLTVMGVFRDGE